MVSLQTLCSYSVRVSRKKLRFRIRVTDRQLQTAVAVAVAVIGGKVAQFQSN